MLTIANSSSADQRHASRGAGFTMIEMVIVVAMVALLGLVAYPGYRALALKARRGDAQAALAAAQQAQERWRAQNATYANADDLRLPPESPMGHYRLNMRSPSATGFELIATAIDSQADDAPCRVMRIVQSAGATRYASGHDDQAANAEDANRRCWVR